MYTSNWRTHKHNIMSCTTDPRVCISSPCDQQIGQDDGMENCDLCRPHHQFAISICLQVTLDAFLQTSCSSCLPVFQSCCSLQQSSYSGEFSSALIMVETRWCSFEALAWSEVCIFTCKKASKEAKMD